MGERRSACGRCFSVPPSPVGPLIVSATLDAAFGSILILFDRALQPGVPDNANWQCHADGEVWDAVGVGNIFGNAVMLNMLRTGIPSALQVVDYFGVGVPIKDLSGLDAPVQTDVPLMLG